MCSVHQNLCFDHLGQPEISFRWVNLRKDPRITFISSENGFQQNTDIWSTIPFPTPGPNWPLLKHFMVDAEEKLVAMYM